MSTWFLESELSTFYNKYLLLPLTLVITSDNCTSVPYLINSACISTECPFQVKHGQKWAGYAEYSYNKIEV